MEKVILKAEIREEFGKESGSRMRKSGIVPAIVYKQGDKALPLKVDARELFHVLHTSAGGNVIINLNIASDDKAKSAKNDKTVIIKEIQYHPIKGDVLHLDFHEISLTDKINVTIAIETKGEPEGVTSDGGILDHPTKELHVECLPTEIPERIDVHVEMLKMGEGIRVKDLDIPDGITVLNDPEQTVCSVVVPKAEEEVSEEEAASEEVAEPEVIREKKPEEGAEASGESQPAPAKEEKKQ
ncbi:MAG: 50S ribosomal protein L25 [Candidatus Orphnella occulta]|nr:50S ribosomal protein L25 [Candidatus Orphnella occulta]